MLFRLALMETWIAVALGIVSLAVGTQAKDNTWGGLYPRESISREVRSLDGLWNFRLSPLHDPDKGFREEWYAQPLGKVCTCRY